MCTICNGIGRVATSPYPGKLIVEVGTCICVKDMTSYQNLEQQLQELDKKIDDFERRL
ncbi:hypothetical protein [Priestia megaterium]|uniref:hypothetical protein n=1 Tax=Priestia megaterium TaxID=1404 RepID=UPI00164337B2|nr:hypothetical protein [Priestia megaterium]